MSERKLTADVWRRFVWEQIKFPILRNKKEQITFRDAMRKCFLRPINWKNSNHLSSRKKFFRHDCCKVKPVNTGVSYVYKNPFKRFGCNRCDVRVERRLS